MDEVFQQPGPCDINDLLAVDITGKRTQQVEKLSDRFSRNFFTVDGLFSV